ncbi:MAG: prepilin-type N-terminal cleavage/methylation domain-containing protein, partial [Planctomycetota bacterium]
MRRLRGETGTDRRRGFTLAELMVAVAVLIVIVLAVGKIFGTVSTVTSIGSATNDVLQETAAIERQLRQDLARISTEGVLAIQSNAVRNDIHGTRLLNPNLPPNAIIRADQLVFFTQGIATTQTYSPGYGTAQKAQSTSARVYYGHGFQLPPPITQPFGFHGNNKAHDPDPPGPDNDIWPWYQGTANMAATTITGPNPSWARSGLPAVDATQPEARQWVLVRQPVLLTDDGGSLSNVFLNHIAAPSVFWADPAVRNGRVDVAGTTLNDIRRAVAFDGSGNLLPWRDGGGDQWSNMFSGIVYFPRGERLPPGPHRVDQ